MKDLFDDYDDYDDDTDTSELMDERDEGNISSFSSEVKEESGFRLNQALVIHFEELITLTRLGVNEGALLILVIDSEGNPHEMWLPKKLCSNLDRENKTVCVWDKVMEKKIDDIGGLNYEPVYASEVYK